MFGKKRGSGETVWEIKQQFGVVSQAVHRKYLKGWTAVEVVISGFFDSIGIYQQYGAKEVERAMQWLEVLGIADVAKQLYAKLSFGQQQLLLIARAMVKSPRVLILDEPCIGLDDEFRAKVLALIDSVAVQTATQIVYVSHTLGERPDCINCHWRFESRADGLYDLLEIQ